MATCARSSFTRLPRCGPPVVPVAPVERPFDPDDLPLEADRTREEDDLATHLQAHPYASVASGEPVHGKSGMLRGRRLRLRLPGSSHHAR